MNSQTILRRYFRSEISLLNGYIESWLSKNFKDNNYNMNDFTISYDIYSSKEINILIDCYNTYNFYNQTNAIDKDAIDKDVAKALIIYYYHLQILEYDVLLCVTEKWLTIKDEKIINLFGDKKSLYFSDILGNSYTSTDNDYYYKEGYIAVRKTINDTDSIYYVNKERNNDKYFYTYASYSYKPQKIKLSSYLNCFEEFHSKKSKNIMNELILRDTDYSSQIRRKMLGIELN